MPKFVVAPHFRLQEWVAEEKGYFAAEGLDYEFREALNSSSGGGHQLGNKVGAYQTLEAGRTCNVSGACHWTMNVAASNGHGKLYAECYSVSPCGIFVPANSPVKTPARSCDRADFRRLSVRQPLLGHPGARAISQAHRHQAVVHDGLLFRRMEMLIDGKIPAASLFSGPYYFVEQLGFRKIIDTTFMIASIVTGTPIPRMCANISARCAARNATSICGPSSIRTITRKNFRCASTIRWIRGAGAPASGSSSSRIRGRPSRNLRMDRPARDLSAQRNGYRQIRSVDFFRSVGEIVRSFVAAWAIRGRLRLRGGVFTRSRCPPYGAGSKSPRTRANTARNISGVSTPVLVL